MKNTITVVGVDIRTHTGNLIEKINKYRKEDGNIMLVLV